MAATLPYALRKQLEAADKCFSDGNIKGGKMHADMAAALFSSAPEAQCAQAAFKVHAAAATKDKTKTDHYAVLGVKLSATGKPDATTTDAVRKQHKALCAMFATAKDTSAAVAAANKLVDEALSALTDIKKSDVMSPPPTSTSTYSYQQKQQVARRKAKQRQEDQEFRARAASYQEEEEDDYYGGGRDKDAGRGGRHRGR